MEKSLTECRDDSYTIFVTFYKEPTRKDKIQQIQHRWIDNVIEFCHNLYAQYRHNSYL